MLRRRVLVLRLGSRVQEAAKVVAFASASVRKLSQAFASVTFLAVENRREKQNCRHVLRLGSNGGVERHTKGKAARQQRALAFCSDGDMCIIPEEVDPDI